MALDTTLLTRQRIVCAKAEIANGTAVTPDAAAFSLFNVIFEPKITAEIQSNDRPGSQYANYLGPIPGARRGKFTFRTEFFGSGTAGAGAAVPAWASLLLPACGMKLTTATFAPVTADATNTFKNITMGLWEAGRLKLISGAGGTFTIRGKAGSPLYFEWAFDGVWQQPGPTAAPSPTYPTVKPPRFAGATLSAGGQNLIFPEIELAMNAKVYLRESQGDVDVPGSTGSSASAIGTGFRAAIVVERRPTLKIAPESLPFGTLDFFAAHTAMTTYSLSMLVGAGADGNSLTIAAPKAQLDMAPEDVDREGILADGLTFILARNTGDDEVTALFT